MSSLQKDTKIYGAVESESYITFTGFCKRIYDTTQQSVDVFIDEKKVDTILADQKIRDIENKYEVFDTNGFCFTYELPKEYIGQKHKLEFKTKEGEQLLHSPTHTLDRFSPLYNQVMFIESLNEPINEKEIKDLYCPNVIGFLATEENLRDEEFMGYVKEIVRQFSDVKFKAFCFNEAQVNFAKKVFNGLRIEFYIVKDIKELVREIAIYLYNTKYPESFLSLYEHIIYDFNNIYFIRFEGKAKKRDIHAQDLASQHLPYYTNPDYFSLVIEDESIFKSIYNPILKKIGEKPIDVTRNLAIFQHFDQIRFALKGVEFAQYMTTLNNKYRQYLRA